MAEPDVHSELHAKSGCVYIIGCLLRPGTLSFATQLEHDYFPPDTDENELYQIFQLQYCRMPYYIIEIPHQSFHVAEALAKELDLKMINGKPTNASASASASAGAGASAPFGLLCSADMCFTLETNHDKGAAITPWTEQLKDEQIRVRDRLKMIQTDIDNEQKDY